MSGLCVIYLKIVWFGNQKGEEPYQFRYHSLNRVALPGYKSLLVTIMMIAFVLNVFMELDFTGFV